MGDCRKQDILEGWDEVAWTWGVGFGAAAANRSCGAGAVDIAHTVDIRYTIHAVEHVLI